MNDLSSDYSMIDPPSGGSIMEFLNTRLRAAYKMYESFRASTGNFLNSFALKGNSNQDELIISSLALCQ